MATEVKTITVEPDSDLARWLDETGDRPLVMINGCTRYRVTREAEKSKDDFEDPWANYDPKRLREELQRVQGILSPEEAEAWIADIYRWREEGSRPPDRP